MMYRCDMPRPCTIGRQAQGGSLRVTTGRNGVVLDCYSYEPLCSTELLAVHRERPSTRASHLRG
jgi:hypothetical protein